MEGRGKREGTRERIKTSSNKTITMGIGTQFPFTFSYNPNVQPNTMNRYKSCYYNLSDTQFAVSNSSTKQKTMERENKAGSFAAWHCKHRPRRLSLFSKWLSASNSCGPPNETTFRCQWWNQTTFAHISPTRWPCHGQHLRSLIGKKLQ